MRTYKPKIFISHSHEDNVVARQLETELKAAGVEVWVDYSDIRSGNIPEQVSKALKWCNILLLLWSKAASKSFWVKLEWTTAIHPQKVIIPCLLDETPVPAILAPMAYIDYRNIDQGIGQLLNALSLARQRVESPPKDYTAQVALVLHEHLRKPLMNMIVETIYSNLIWVISALFLVIIIYQFANSNVGGHHIPQGRATSIPHLGPRVFPRVDHEYSPACSGDTRGIVRVNLTDFCQSYKCSVKFFGASFLRIDSPFS